MGMAFDHPAALLSLPRAWWRLARHRWGELQSRAAMSDAVLQRLGDRVAASEATHTGQIRVVVEAGLPWSYLRRSAAARERALALFGKYRVWDTELNNGVLIYLLMAEHAIEIVADRGLARHVPQAHWQAMVAQMSTHFRQADYEAGLAQAVDNVSQQLARHFPRHPAAAAHANELPDKPIVR